MLHDAVHHSLEKPLIDTALQLFEGMYLMYYSNHVPERDEIPP